MSAAIQQPANQPEANQPARQSTLDSGYYADYLALQERCAADPAWLMDLRSSAWERFDAAGFPTARRGNEPWKYTSVAPIARAKFAYPLPNPGAATVQLASQGTSLPQFPSPWRELTLVDGRPLQSSVRGGAEFSLAKDGFICCSLSKALTTEPEIVQQGLGRLAPQDDAFVSLNTAFLNDGFYVRLPDDYSEPVYLNIVHIQQSPATVAYPRLLIMVGRNAKLTVFESYLYVFDTGEAAPPQKGCFTNAVVEVDLEAGAQVCHYRLLNESPSSYHVGTTRIRQAEDSSYTAGSFARGMALGRHDLSVLLDGPGASCALNGLYLTDDTQHMDNLVSIDHAQPNGSSRLYYKGILDGRSKAVFGGTVLVRKDAQKTDAQQTDKNLILSDRAEVDSKPSLLIYADDVKCGHGATAGHIDEDTLFYMRSRGLDSETASRILIHAFAGEIIDSVSHPPAREYLDRLFLSAIGSKTIGGRVEANKKIPNREEPVGEEAGGSEPGSGQPRGGA